MEPPNSKLDISNWKPKISNIQSFNLDKIATFIEIEFKEKNWDIDSTRNIGSAIIWYNRVDYALNRVSNWQSRISSQLSNEQVSSRISLLPARSEIVKGSYHFVRTLCVECPSKEFTQQLDKLQVHFEQALRLIYIAVLQEIVITFDEIKSNYKKTSIQFKNYFSDYDKTVTLLQGTRHFLEEKEKEGYIGKYEEYEEHFDNLQEKIFRLICCLDDIKVDAEKLEHEKKFKLTDLGFKKKGVQLRVYALLLAILAVIINLLNDSILM